MTNTQLDQRVAGLLADNGWTVGGLGCALLGENIQEGVCGFGKTPALAMTAFDLAWLNGNPTKEGA